MLSMSLESSRRDDYNGMRQHRFPWTYKKIKIFMLEQREMHLNWRGCQRDCSVR